MTVQDLISHLNHLLQTNQISPTDPVRLPISLHAFQNDRRIHTSNVHQTSDAADLAQIAIRTSPLDCIEAREILLGF
jgi:hypothetical protein